MPQRLTKEEFISRCKDIHGDKYDYSKVEYKNVITKVCIICNEHGEFFVRPNDLLRGHGCPVCSGVKKMNTEEFIDKAKKKYGNKYDYSKVDYKNNKTKVCLICHEKDKYGIEHGEFWQRPSDHLSGYECPKCKNEYKPTSEEWINIAKLVHGDRYDYSKVNYVSALKKVCIICKEHGEFWQTPVNHIFNEANCPICNSNEKSKMEENIGVLLKEHNLTFERQKTFDWLKYKRHLYLDYFVPKYNIAIEVNGEQHYRPIKKFGGEKFFNTQKERDCVKNELCKEHGIKLFYVTKKNNNINEILEYINNGTAN